MSKNKSVEKAIQKVRNDLKVVGELTPQQRKNYILGFARCLHQLKHIDIVQLDIVVGHFH